MITLKGEFPMICDTGYLSKDRNLKREREIEKSKERKPGRKARKKERGEVQRKERRRKSHKIAKLLVSIWPLAIMSPTISHK